MRARFVYEAMGDVLKPKSEEQIFGEIKNMTPEKLNNIFDDLEGNDESQKSIKPILFRFIEKLPPQMYIQSLIKLIDEFDYGKLYTEAKRRLRIEIQNNKVDIIEHFEDLISYAEERPSFQLLIKPYLFRDIKKLSPKKYIETLQRLTDFDLEILRTGALTLLKNEIFKDKMSFKDIELLLKRRSIHELKPKIFSYILKKIKSSSIENKLKMIRQLPFDVVWIRGVRELVKEPIKNIIIKELKSISTFKLFKLYLENNLTLLAQEIRTRKDFQSVMLKLSEDELEKLIRFRNDGIEKHAREIISGSPDANNLLRRGIRLKSIDMVKKAVEMGVDQLWFEISDFGYKKLEQHLVIGKIIGTRNNNLKIELIKGNVEWNADEGDIVYNDIQVFSMKPMDNDIFTNEVDTRIIKNLESAIKNKTKSIDQKTEDLKTLEVELKQSMADIDKYKKMILK